MIHSRALVGKFDHDAMVLLRLTLRPSEVASLLGIPQSIVYANKAVINVPYSIGQLASALALCGLLQYEIKPHLFELGCKLPRLCKILKKLVDSRAPAEVIHAIVADKSQRLHGFTEQQLYLKTIARALHQAQMKV